MKEYTIISSIAALAAVALDMIAGTKLIKDKRFWIFWGVMIFFMFLVNGYLTWRPIVIYGEQFNLNVRIFTIPVEDFLFGFSLVTLNIIIWEYLSKKLKREKR